MKCKFKSKEIAEFRQLVEEVRQIRDITITLGTGIAKTILLKQSNKRVHIQQLL
jgi:hypothetical protein